MNNTKNPTSQSKPTNRRVNSHANFIEALKSAGGDIARDTARGFSQDLIAGSIKQTADTLFNSYSTPSSDNSQEQQESIDFSEYINQQEQARAHQRVQQEYEQRETVIFSRRQQEVEKKIEEVRLELKKLAQEIINLDQSTQAVIAQEVIAPGTYHLNFFEKLAQFLRTMRKRVAESRHWAAMQNQRSQHQSYYWHMSGKKTGGTKFSLSHERTVATQTG